MNLIIHWISREQFNLFTTPLSSQKLSQKLFLPHPKTVHAQENFSLIYDYLLCMLIFFFILWRDSKQYFTENKFIDKMISKLLIKFSSILDFLF
jgi:hypothetical protein